jgi:hypothetical protein
MKKCTLLLAVVCLFGFSVHSFAADPVDLSGKTGVVDPKDLKKDDPKPPKLDKTVPPLPESSSSAAEKSDGPDKPRFSGSYGQAK